MIAHEPESKTPWYKRLWRKVKSVFTKRRLFEATYFTVGTVASAVVMINTLPLWLATLIFTTLFVHEFGHYISAHRHGRVVRLPFFLPLYWGMQGGTRVKGFDPPSDMSIALAGPRAGIVISILALCLFVYMGFMPGVWASLWIFAFQLYSATLGHDGRKYWRARSVLGNAQQPTASPAFVV